MNQSLLSLNNTLSHQQEKKSIDNFFNLDYYSTYTKTFLSLQATPTSRTIIRDGFLSIERFLDFNPNNENFVYPALFSQFSKHNLTNHLFYQIQSNLTSMNSVNNLLLLIETSNISLDFNSISNSIKKLSHSLPQLSDFKIYFILSDLNINSKTYLDLKSLLNLQFSSHVERIDFKDLQKINNLSNWAIIDLFNMQSCSDNFITHLCLSKQANYIRETISISTIETYSISPYHSLVIGKN
jgi:hypothetical protein